MAYIWITPPLQQNLLEQYFAVITAPNPLEFVSTSFAHPIAETFASFSLQKSRRMENIWDNEF